MPFNKVAIIATLFVYTINIRKNTFLVVRRLNEMVGAIVALFLFTLEFTIKLFRYDKIVIIQVSFVHLNALEITVHLK